MQKTDRVAARIFIIFYLSCFFKGDWEITHVIKGCLPDINREDIYLFIDKSI